MTNVPNFGDRVTVWPMPKVRVQDGEGKLGVAMAEGGREVEWSEFWYRRLLDGAISFTDPRPVAEDTPVARKR